MQGKFIYYSGASGTVTLPNGATVKQVYVHSSVGGTVTIFGGQSIPIIAGTSVTLRMMHDNCVASEVAGGSAAIVLTNTDSYYIETIGSAY